MSDEDPSVDRDERAAEFATPELERLQGVLRRVAYAITDVGTALQSVADTMVNAGQRLHTEVDTVDE